MAKRKNGCWIHVITLILVIVVLMAIDGSLGVLLSIISIPVGLIALISYFSTERKENKPDRTADKFNGLTPKKNKKSFKPQQFKYKNKELVGRIEGVNLPNEIKNISDLKSLVLSTTHPFEISDFVNKNPEIRYLSLTGPFWFKNNIKPTLNHLTINSNDNFYTVIRQFSNLHQLHFLTLRINNLKVEEILQFCRSVNTLSLHIGLIEFPYEVLRLPNLQFLDLSHNKIETISEQNIKYYSSKKLKIQTLNLSFNKLKTVPSSLFELNTRITINLKENPIKTRYLKKLYKEYNDQVGFSYDQNRIATRTFHPQTWLTLKILLSLLLVLFPIMILESFLGSVLLGVFVWSAWRV
ncbi:leucine-rich repeat domain-containing protein [Salegentibacter maritimus]|uniref:leucine-rich repeat domain-containing protein n=1 Tax=Salegentibacter maritimus TaxID=2794347 RepID=UPI0018E458C4|nr:leucine-rich repeat domain-containing protein [Salegentibacter maritimus]MBI6115978.1 leucine-rich repeat domain-containing protein [Salegentibacter maritimus]